VASSSSFSPKREARPSATLGFGAATTVPPPSPPPPAVCTVIALEPTSKPEVAVAAAAIVSSSSVPNKDLSPNKDSDLSPPKTSANERLYPRERWRPAPPPAADELRPPNPPPSPKRSSSDSSRSESEESRFPFPPLPFFFSSSLPHFSPPPLSFCRLRRRLAVVSPISRPRLIVVSTASHRPSHLRVTPLPPSSHPPATVV
jgi:hypothetical protein